MEAIILSSWDHIMGPQVENLWYPVNKYDKKLFEIPGDVLKHFNITKHLKDGFDCSKSNCLPDLRVYSMMCGQLLLGEVDSRELCEEWVSRFYLSESKIMVSVVFHLNSWECAEKRTNDKELCLCFGTIFKRHAINFALENQQIIDIQLRKAVEIVQNSKIPLEFLMKEITAVVHNLAEVLGTLETTNLKFIQPYENQSFQELLRSELITKAVVSHLQTSGSSVVLGTSNFLMNQVMYVLSLLSLREAYFSIFPNSTNSYIRGIYIQGSKKATEIDYKYLSEVACKDCFSLTIIDVDSTKVWQCDTLKISSERDSFRNSLSSVVDTGEIVPRLLKDLSFIQNNEGDCRYFVESFFQFLMVEAASLIKAVESFKCTHLGLNEKIDINTVSSYNMTDFKILIGCAEKLKPGIRNLFLLE